MTVRGTTAWALALWLIAACAAPSRAQQEAASWGTAFVDVTVISMRGDGAVPHQTVLVRGDTILAVGRTAELPIPAEFRVVAANGRYLIPGLIDSHVHLSDTTELGAILRHGVTSVLQMSGQRGAIADFRELRARIERGELAGPRLFLAGPIFDRFGLPATGSAYAIADANAVDALAEAHRTAGYDFFKVHNQIPHDVYGALTHAGLPVIGHIPMHMPLDAALTSGQVMIAHAELFYYNLFGFPAVRNCTAGFWPCVAAARADTGVIGDVVARVARSGVSVTANLAYIAAEERVLSDFESVLRDPEFTRLSPALQAGWRSDGPDQRAFVAERRQDLANRASFTRLLVRRLHDAGVPVLAGTDAPLPGVFPGKSLHTEMRELVAAGLSPRAALHAATAAPGDFLQRHVPNARALGRIEPGYAADLVLLASNPLEDIAATARIVGTMARGVWREHSR